MNSSSAPNQAGKAPVQKALILVVEDEFLIRALISDALRDEGYDVIEAFNGDEAVDILNAGKAVDLVFSDVRMPGSTDGLALLGFVRQRFPALPIILASGHLEPGVASAQGATNFLSKPYPIEMALGLIASELAKSS